MPARLWLQHYATLFDTVEVNTTFYRLPSRDAVANWAAQTPPDFLFAVKASRYLTHIKRLTDLGEGVERFYERIEPLIDAGKLGPVLWQLPGELPAATWSAWRAALRAASPGRHCFEFRHPSWFTDDVYALLRRHGSRAGHRRHARAPVPDARDDRRLDLRAVPPRRTRAARATTPRPSSRNGPAHRARGGAASRCSPTSTTTGSAFAVRNALALKRGAGPGARSASRPAASWPPASSWWSCFGRGRLLRRRGAPFDAGLRRGALPASTLRRREALLQRRHQVGNLLGLLGHRLHRDLLARPPCARSAPARARGTRRGTWSGRTPWPAPRSAGAPSQARARSPSRRRRAARRGRPPAISSSANSIVSIVSTSPAGRIATRYSFVAQHDARDRDLVGLAQRLEQQLVGL